MQYLLNFLVLINNIFKSENYAMKYLWVPPGKIKKFLSDLTKSINVFYFGLIFNFGLVNSCQTQIEN